MANKKYDSGSNFTPWFIAIILVLLVIGGIILVFSSKTPASNFKETVVPAISQSDWMAGKKDAKVSLIEYGDFQCPACAAYRPLLKQLIAEYGDRITFVYRNFPLYKTHPNAEISAEAAEAAGLQGKYWEMHDVLFEKQSDWALASNKSALEKFNAYAEELGLDIDRFAHDMKSDQIKNKIKSDVNSGNAAVIDHTPTFFINLKQIPNPSSNDEFKILLDNALAL